MLVRGLALHYTMLGTCTNIVVIATGVGVRQRRGRLCLKLCLCDVGCTAHKIGTGGRHTTLFVRGPRPTGRHGVYYSQAGGHQGPDRGPAAWVLRRGQIGRC